MGELTVSLRSVNHRGLDIHFQQTPEFAPYENALRTVLKEAIGRGHVEVRANLTRDNGTASAGYNREVLARYLAVHKQAAQEFSIATEPDLNLLLRMPGVIDNDRISDEFPAGFEAELVEVMTGCASELNAFRAREGGELQASIRTELASIVNQTAAMADERTRAVKQIQQRLQDRIQALLAGNSLDQRRLAEEVALLADRSDVQEELTRLEIHTRELERILDEGGEVGKRLDFLLQEMNRETNTILSKTSGAVQSGLAITNTALATKAHIEKIREQALNLE